MISENTGPATDSPTHQMIDTLINTVHDGASDRVEIDPGPMLARRGMMLGAGAAALAVGSLVAARPAAAEPKAPRPGGSGTSPAAAHTDASPVATTMASPAISGYTYRHVAWMDFSPESSGSDRRWSFNGVYATTDSTLWASMEIPAGALVRDIEWYVRNGSAVTATCLARVWAAGTATLYPTLVDTDFPGGSEMMGRRSVVPSAKYGPHPLGTKIALGVPTRADGSVSVTGARVGFTQGSGAIGILPTPLRAYDSRVTGGKLAAGSTRTITLSSATVPPGTTGVLINITATAPEGSGYVTVYPGNAAAPATSSVNFQTGKTVANAMIVGVSSSRQLKIKASDAVHVIIDISGTVG